MTCPLPINVTVYDGSANSFALAVDGDDGELMTSLASLTRVVITVGATVVDSDVEGSGVIWWTDTGTYRGQVVGIIRFRLGDLGIAVGEYADCQLDIHAVGLSKPLRVEVPINITVAA